MRTFLTILVAVILHAAFLLFGGLLFPKPEEGEGSLQTVDLVSDSDPGQEKKDKPKEEEKAKENPEEVVTEKAPDVAEAVRTLELSATAQAPALEAASLSAIEAALSGQGSAGGDFGQSLSFSSGGVIGGTGKAGGTDEQLDKAFSIEEIDQKPRCVYQASPNFPNEMRGKKIEGVVTLIFMVDSGGKVSNPRVEKASHNAFERPALDAVRNWKFEPAVRGGERVACKMRITIRFQQG